MLQHSISLYLGETTLTEPGGVFLDFYPPVKQMVFPQLNSNLKGCWVTGELCYSADSNSSYISNSVTTKVRPPLKKGWFLLFAFLALY